MKSLYKSAEKKKEILAIYQEKLQGLTMAYSTQKVSTTFGETNVIITGNPYNPPLILLHGANACAPVALDEMEGLSSSFRVYAVDIIGQPTLSAETRPSMKTGAYGQWLNEVISQLSLVQVTLVGVSFGGFVCLKTLIQDQSKIKKAFLIVPVGIINAKPWGGLFGLFLPLQLFMLTKNETFLRTFLNALFTENDPYAFKSLSRILLYFKQDFTLIPLISEEEGKKITVPLYVVAGTDDKFFPGKQMLDRAAKIFPSFANALLLKNTKHVPSQTQNREIERFIAETI